MWWGEGSGCSSIAPLRLHSGAPAIFFPGLIVVSFPIQFPDFNFFCLCQAASNLFAIITSCSRSSVNSAAQAPGEMLVCCPWSRAPGDRCAFLPPSTPACSPDPTAPLPASKAAGLGQHRHRGHLLPPWMGVAFGEGKSQGLLTEQLLILLCMWGARNRAWEESGDSCTCAAGSWAAASRMVLEPCAARQVQIRGWEMGTPGAATAPNTRAAHIHLGSISRAWPDPSPA